MRKLTFNLASSMVVGNEHRPAGFEVARLVTDDAVDPAEAFALMERRHALPIDDPSALAAVTGATEPEPEPEPERATTEAAPLSTREDPGGDVVAIPPPNDPDTVAPDPVANLPS